MIKYKLTKDQALGAYIGMAVGDAYGAPFEFLSKEQIRGANIPKVAQYYEGGAHNVIKGEWTDDTAMARCITQVLLEHGSMALNPVMRNFSDWYAVGAFGTRDHCFDIGGTCSSAIRDWENGTTTKLGPNSGQGNGGIMRLGPVFTFFAESSEMAKTAAVQSSHLTHKAEICDLYAECMADLVFDKEFMDDTIGSYNFQHPSGLDGSGHVEETFWNAFYCVATTNSFFDAIYAAVQMGGDTDTTAAVAGIIAGSRYGLSGIPQNLIDGLVESESLLDEAELLYDAGIAKRNMIN